MAAGKDRPTGFDDRDEVTFPMNRPIAHHPVEALRNAVRAFSHHSDETVITNPDLVRSTQLPNHYLTMRDLRGLEAWLDNAFELGVKSAGGTIIPDGSNFVEIALDRETIDALAISAERALGEGKQALTSIDCTALKQFLETVSIYRSRK